ncbi:MAG: phage virion morphogenesis protein [Rhodobacteraceae bacterium]|nr:phage virion morphogenesis protein [Paracoccaceae bacterium]
MAGAQIELTLQGIERVEAALGRLGSADLDDMAYNVGALLEASTRERIATEKRSPDGAAWAPWSDARPATRQPRHSLLVQDNHLLTSIQNHSEGATVKIGSNMVYAAIHQVGGQAGRNRAVTIPARPYLGLSDADERAIHDLIAEALAEVLQ